VDVAVEVVAAQPVDEGPRTPGAGNDLVGRALGQLVLAED
jgi:hypothetical protein